MESALPKDLRRKLESVVVKARDIAEGAARTELERLAVGEKSAAGYLSAADRKLRNRLRAHGRQLGDRRKPDGVQAIDQLATEIAYEHWHRMLFARFLAESHLLIYEDGVTPLSIDDCFDLAEEETGDRSQGWQYASRYASKMLPQIFRVDSPAFELNFAPNDQKQLEDLLASLDEATFLASDALGWVYQFWQSKKKDEVNASEVKIGARELPAVTQLFTEPYMVSFLLDNSLGAWWAARRLSGADLENASSEEELRRKAAIPGAPLDYLRFVQQEGESGHKRWTPAAGTFDGWPEQLADLETLDPCCGSGHFLVAAFLMLVPMRMERDGLPAKEAVDAVLRENIHGLELDQRCVELAAFALALTAWKYPNAGGFRVLPELNVACSGLSVSVAKEEWKQLGSHLGGGKKNLPIALDWMHDTFKDAPVLGSLLNPAKTDAAKLVQWDELSGALEQALKQEQSEEQQEVAVVAQGLAKAATLLAGRYEWVITNVPYLARGKQNERLRDFCETHYPAAKNDLATVFLERCLELCVQGGTSSVVLPQNWLFLTSYRKFREKLLKNDTWHLIARLGPGAFETISGEVVKAILISLSRGNSTKESGGLFGDTGNGNRIRGVDVSEPRTAADKAAQLLTAEIKSVEQAKQLENPDAAILFEELSNAPALGEYALVGYGSKPGQTSRVTRNFWEIYFPIHGHWQLMESSPSGNHTYCGKAEVCLSIDEIERQGISEFGVRGRDAWNRKGIAFAKMRHLPASIYCGEFYDDNTYTIIPNSDDNLPAFACYCFSPAFNEDLRRINQKLNVTRELVAQVPFDLDHWAKVAEEEYPNGLPKPYTNDSTQWIFHGHPCGSVVWDEEKKWTAQGLPRTDDGVLQVAVSRLLGYRWPVELDASIELADEQREWVTRCEALSHYADDDGIVCIPAVRGEQPADQRLEALLQAAYGEQWSLSVRDRLLESTDCKNKSIDFWLREKFFEQHCKSFQHRPFIWHVWDGLKDGFSALVNYHHLDRKNLERLIYTYLDDWIRTQKHDKAEGIDGAGVRLAAAEGLKRRLEQILEGEAPYDIFVRWKPLEEQPVGWTPDLNDGVRLNIRPFLSVEDVGKKGAGILRAKPNINWNKDRGKDMVSAPWYSLGLEYGEGEGARINDHHLSLADKKVAREA
ncbi:restriction endonuclease subunit M [Kineobactrum sediminis]|uniref:site-specific DNA-methyltransferase (adenine-specific) n=1 Tax=Kineobactrum sediminis TaxID=1905677 RepID=A0A2N5Y4N5_9GAMM|nr:N-6 DNA methylase [Kineobactrum sediminis]PLW83356.1 restriction endonuclease subunit M [Kineobactrum sediminis]